MPSINFVSMDFLHPDVGSFTLLSHTRVVGKEKKIAVNLPPHTRMLPTQATKWRLWGCGVVVCTLDFKSEGQWFKAQSLPWCCFLGQETLPHIVSLYPGV